MKIIGTGVILAGVAALVPIYLWIFGFDRPWLTNNRMAVGGFSGAIMISIGLIIFNE
jgi:hypothetical protein